MTETFILDFFQMGYVLQLYAVIHWQTNAQITQLPIQWTYRNTMGI